MEIPQEQFNYQKTLADIGVQISQSRAVLSEMKMTQDKFLADQEELALKRIQKVLDVSQEALGQASKNQDTLTAFYNEVKSFAVELLSFKEKLDTQEQEFIDKSTKIWSKIDQKTKELEFLDKEVKMQQSVTKSDWQQIDLARREVAKQERAVKDKYETLLRTIKRL